MFKLLFQKNKASFLCRDSATLNKLASIVKVPEVEGANTVNMGKGRNFVFAAVSPAVEKLVRINYSYYIGNYYYLYYILGIKTVFRNRK